MAPQATLEGVMRKLKAMGTAQNVKVYRRHGVDGPMFGVSFANLNALQKEIGRNHVLAVRLWATGNHDAQVLASMIADASAITSSQFDRWAKALGNYVVADALSRLVRQSPFVRAKAAEWTKSRNDWIGQAGWNLVSFLALSERSLTDGEFAGYVERIQRNIHASKNRTRYAMNNALIAIGIRNSRLKQKALRASDHIGTVTVKHGETGCKTPDAATYILKAWDRKMA